MHEVGIMESVIERVLEQAEIERAKKVHKVGMRIGTMSGVVPEALRFAFEVVTQGTLAEGAEFRVETVPAHSTCRQCGARFAVRDLASLKCPECDGEPDGFQGGREIELTEIEIS